MEPLPIVAVASSTGDLEAVSELLSALPSGCAEAFVIVQHLESGRREPSLADFIANGTDLPIADAQDGLVPEPGHVYVLRANATLTIVAGRLSMMASASGRHRPGDILFTSLARDYGVQAIGVVLSGGGSDGALGIQAISEAGGTTFAQYPGSARFPSMPINAIETGCVGTVLRPNEIAREITRRGRVTAASASASEIVAPRVPLISVAIAG